MLIKSVDMYRSHKHNFRAMLDDAFILYLKNSRREYGFELSHSIFCLVQKYPNVFQEVFVKVHFQGW
jgi:hypothetical protein